MKIVSRSTFSIKAELTGEGEVVNISLRATNIVNDEVEKIDTHETIQKCTFETENNLWQQDTKFSSVNRFDNRHFDSIVKDGEKNLPYIYEELKKGPSKLVHALEIMYPEKVTYSGFITLNQARRIWLKILQKELSL